MIPNPVRVRAVAAEAVGAFYPTLLDWSKTALEREVSLHGSKDRDDTGTSLTCLPNKQVISNMTGNQKTPTRYVTCERMVKQHMKWHPTKKSPPFLQESRAYPFSPASVVLVNDALQLFLALFAVSLRVGLSSLFYDGSLVSRYSWRRRTENG